MLPQKPMGRLALASITPLWPPTSLSAPVWLGGLLTSRMRMSQRSPASSLNCPAILLLGFGPQGTNQFTLEVPIYWLKTTHKQKAAIFKNSFSIFPFHISSQHHIVEWARTVCVIFSVHNSWARWQEWGPMSNSTHHRGGSETCRQRPPGVTFSVPSTPLRPSAFPGTQNCFG